MTKTMMGARILLASTAAACVFYAGAASAQVVRSPDPGGSTPAPSRAQTAAPTDPSAPTVLVRIRRDGRYEAARAFSPGDDYLVPTLDDWRRMNPGMTPEQVSQSFTAIATENETVCSKVAGFVVRIDGLISRYEGRRTEIADLAVRIEDLKGTYRRATTARRTGTGVGTVFLCLASFGWYCGGAVSSAIGNEANATGSDRGRDVQRDAMALSMDLNQDHVESAILSQEMNLAWVELVHDYCNANYRSVMPTLVSSAS